MLSDALRLLAAGFTMGWGPCLTYTAPLLLPYIGATKRGWRDGLKVALVFSLGRLVALAILGGLATVAFAFINQFFPPHRSAWLYLVSALFMITVGVLIILGKGSRIGIWKSVLEKGTASIFLFGLLMGIAPCVPYVAILTYIACAADGVILRGVLYAALFAAGTAVAPVVLGIVMAIVPHKVLKSDRLMRVFQVGCGAALVLFGLELIYNVLNLVL